MPLAVPHRLTDCFWLAAYDNVNGKPRIDGRSLGLGLGAGLLAELIRGKFLELRQGVLFRATVVLPDDLASRPLMVTMAAEEDGWSSLPPPPPVPVPAYGPAEAYEPNERSPEAHGRRQQPVTRGGRDRPQQDPARQLWPPHAQGRSGWYLPVPEKVQDTRRGHLLGNWLSFLAYERNAERRVAQRLVLAGLARQQEHRRWLGSPVVEIAPCDSVIAGKPANRISDAVHRGRVLSRADLLLAGLFLATGLHKHALATLNPDELSELGDTINRDLDRTSLELLSAVDTAVGEAAMRKR